MRRTAFIAGLSTVLLTISACASGSDDSAADPAPTTTPPATAPAESSAPTSSTEGPAPAPDSIEGTVVRFTSGETSVDVTITADNPTTRDLLSKLPLTIEEFSGREKISYLPDGLETEGSPGYDPVDGDLIYFVPWGNLGFYYNADGIGFSDDTIQLGTYEASTEQLERLEDNDVTVELIS